ncbi:MAG: hypothetical protein ACO23C_07155 [Prochlorococcaceae cyanobacterium]
MGETDLGRILPVQNAAYPYDVAALNNLYGSPEPAPAAANGRGCTDVSRTVDMSDFSTPANTTAEPTSTDALSSQQQQRLDAVITELEALAGELSGNPQGLLTLLRQLEQLHRTLQDGAFRSSLPADRSALFNLLREMEQSGGWPYIPRLQLRTFMDLLQRDRHDDDHPLAA